MGTDLPEEVVVRVLDDDGRAVRGQVVAFVVTTGGGTPSPATVDTDGEGLARTRWTLGTSAGTQSLEARVVGGETGGTLTAVWTATARAGDPAVVSAVSPATLTGTAGSPLDSLVVRVSDSHGNPVSGAAVVWNVRSGGGSVSPPSTTTGADGTARAQWTLGTRADSAQVVEALAGMSLRTTFTANVTVPFSAILMRVSGEAQTDTVGRMLPNQLVARLQLPDGRPLSGVTVTWSVAAGMGGVTPPVSVTDPSGLAFAQWTLGTTPGTHRATATVPGGATVSFSATALAGGLARVELTPDTLLFVSLGDTRRVTAVARDRFGNLLPGTAISLVSLDPGVATVQTDGLVRAMANGTARILASAGGARDTTRVRVQQAVATVQLPAVPDSIFIGDTVRVTATVRDAGGTLVAGADVEYRSSAPAVASVQASGLVTGLTSGDAQITASAGGVSSNTLIRVRNAPRFVSVHTSGGRACALAENGQLFCWGYGRTVPTAEGGTFRFQSVAATEGHICGLNAAGEAFCWGDNNLGELGTGSTYRQISYPTPTPVVGGLRFSSITVAGDRTCALETDGDAYCWGDNGGLAGDSSTFYGQNEGCGAGGADCRASPQRVVGGLKFSAISAAEYHTCAVTTGGEAYCWGYKGGQLGNVVSGQTNSIVSYPVPVLGGVSFRGIATARSVSCGLSTSGDLRCWGRLAGVWSTAATPTEVPGNVTLDTLSAYCGVAPGGQGYCWGRNSNGQVGDGSTTDRPAATPVAGGHRWTFISAQQSENPDRRDGFACGLTTAGWVYCWGENGSGQLGNGTRTRSTVPVPVAPPR